MTSQNTHKTLREEIGDAFFDHLPEPIPPNPDGREPRERPRYVIRDAAYALQPQEPVEDIVVGLISRGSVNLFYGEPGSKKTYIGNSLGVCVSAGKPWLNFVTKQARVLLIDEESGEKRLTRRIAEAIRGELADETIPLQFVCMAGFLLNDPTDAVLLQALIESTGAELVIIDALADIMTGDENSKEDTQPIFRVLRKIADQTNAAIILIHHSNKAGGYRGSSAIKGAVDLMVKITSEDGKPFIDFKTEKARDMEAAKWSAKATWTDDQFYLLPADTLRGDAKLSHSKQYVIRYLTEHGPCLVKEIEEHAEGCSPNAARRAVYDLAGEGVLVRTNSGYAAEYGLAQDDVNE